MAERVLPRGTTHCLWSLTDQARLPWTPRRVGGIQFHLGGSSPEVQLPGFRKEADHRPVPADGKRGHMRENACILRASILD